MGYKCKNCNSDVPEGSNYCTFCGAPIEKMYSKPEVKSKSREGLIIGFIAIFLMAGVFTILYFINSNTGTNNLDTEISEQEESVTNTEPSADISAEDDDIIWGSKSEPLVYSCGGITFEIPEKFGYYSGMFESEYSTLIINSQTVDEGFWETYYMGTGKDYDELADSIITEYLEDPYRELALDSSVAGEKSRYYIYSGLMEGEEIELLIEFILNSNNEKFIVLLLATDQENSEINDYIEMVNNAEYTGAADSIENPRSPFYIAPESLDADEEIINP